MPLAKILGVDYDVPGLAVDAEIAPRRVQRDFEVRDDHLRVRPAEAPAGLDALEPREDLRERLGRPRVSAPVYLDSKRLSGRQRTLRSLQEATLEQALDVGALESLLEVEALHAIRGYRLQDEPPSLAFCEFAHVAHHGRGYASSPELRSRSDAISPCDVALGPVEGRAPDHVFAYRCDDDARLPVRDHFAHDSQHLVAQFLVAVERLQVRPGPLLHTLSSCAGTDYADLYLGIRSDLFLCAWPSLHHQHLVGDVVTSRGQGCAQPVPGTAVLDERVRVVPLPLLELPLNRLYHLLGDLLHPEEAASIVKVLAPENLREDCVTVLGNPDRLVDPFRPPAHLIELVSHSVTA